MLPTPYSHFLDDILSVIPQARTYTDPLRTLAYGTDASFYRLTPKIVVDAYTVDEVVHIVRMARRHKVALTFRAAGTSLSGQSVTDSVLVRLGKGWRDYRVGKDGETVSLQPGIIGSEANRILAPLGRKIGPDPGSIDTCKIGGIAANNASGMCCGVADNSYKTLLSAVIILADGTVLDTADAASRAAFAKSHGHILQGLHELRDRTLANAPLAEMIRRKFKIKNTMGYSINALVDFDDPFEILQHLLIGSEGTLGFLAEVTYRTVVEHPCKASALLLFPSVPEACAAATLLRDQPVSSSELMDRASLRSVEGKAGVPADLADLGADVASLLVETRAATQEELDAQIAAITAAVSGLSLVRDVAFTNNPAEYVPLWNIRKGILPSVGAMRRPGDTCVIEDVAVPLEHLAEAVTDIQKLFAKHGYADGVIFGHARDGNVHFVFNQNFGDGKEVERYSAFMEDICTTIAGTYSGSLKAEHGTGRNMAPFLELEWGADAARLMRDVKTLLDPDCILNPGVILNDDVKAHVKHLKPLTPAHELIDGCTECGFCEPTCPSRNLSLTPRQRISTWREIQRLEDPVHANALRKALRESYTYNGKDTCAADGLCAVRCPAGINTGTFIKHLRAQDAGQAARATARFIRNHFGGICVAGSVLLTTVNSVHRLIGTRLMTFGANAARTVSFRLLPAWNKAMPTGGGTLPYPSSPVRPVKTVVYFPSCISRNMGPALTSEDRRTEPQLAVELLSRAGFRVIFPEKVEKLCCGMAFASKGFTEEAAALAEELNAALLAATENGKYPVLSETSPCLLHMRETLDKRLQLYEPVAFSLEHILPALSPKKLPKTVAVHATCSLRKMGLAEKLTELAALCAENVVTPHDTECCGFAGDRGFTHPELNASALETLRGQVSGCDAGYSTSRTCQVGLTVNGGIPYYSILALVDEATR